MLRDFSLSANGGVIQPAPHRQGLAVISTQNRLSGTPGDCIVNVPGLTTTAGSTPSLAVRRIVATASYWDIESPLVFYYREVNPANVVTGTQGSIPAGTYTGATIAAAIQASLVATSPSGQPYTCGFSPSTGLLTINVNGPANQRWGFGFDSNTYKGKRVFGMEDSGTGAAGSAVSVTSTSVIQISPLVLHLLVDFVTNGYSTIAGGTTNVLAAIPCTAFPFSVLDMTEFFPIPITVGQKITQMRLRLHRTDYDPVQGTTCDMHGCDWELHLAYDYGLAG